jgi:Mg2+ and Co2+ transporter CorA
VKSYWPYCAHVFAIVGFLVVGAALAWMVVRGL